MKTYIFHREEGFYFIDLKDDADAIANAECNEGTLRVESLSGRIVYPITNHELTR